MDKTTEALRILKIAKHFEGLTLNQESVVKEAKKYLREELQVKDMKLENIDDALIILDVTAIKEGLTLNDRDKRNEALMLVRTNGLKSKNDSISNQNRGNFFEDRMM